MYEPTTARFLTPDPAGFGGGDANLYRYVANDPVNHTDPSGRWLFMRPNDVQAIAPVFLGATTWIYEPHGFLRAVPIRTTEAHNQVASGLAKHGIPDPPLGGVMLALYGGDFAKPMTPTGNLESPQGTQNVTLWIDPRTGHLRVGGYRASELPAFAAQLERERVEAARAARRRYAQGLHGLGMGDAGTAAVLRDPSDPGYTIVNGEFVRTAEFAEVIRNRQREAAQDVTTGRAIAGMSRFERNQTFSGPFGPLGPELLRFQRVLRLPVTEAGRSVELSRTPLPIIEGRHARLRQLAGRLEDAEAGDLLGSFFLDPGSGVPAERPLAPSVDSMVRAAVLADLQAIEAEEARGYADIATVTLLGGASFGLGVATMGLRGALIAAEVGGVTGGVLATGHQLRDLWRGKRQELDAQEIAHEVLFGMALAPGLGAAASRLSLFHRWLPHAAGGVAVAGDVGYQIIKRDYLTAGMHVAVLGGGLYLTHRLIAAPRGIGGPIELLPRGQAMSIFRRFWPLWSRGDRRALTEDELVQLRGEIRRYTDGQLEMIAVDENTNPAIGELQGSGGRYYSPRDVSQKVANGGWPVELDGKAVFLVPKNPTLGAVAHELLHGLDEFIRPNWFATASYMQRERSVLEAILDRFWPYLSIEERQAQIQSGEITLRSNWSPHTDREAGRAAFRALVEQMKRRVNEPVITRDH
jgi:hypothetical protein